MKQKKVAVFGDLTALYDAKTELKKNINYLVLDKAIKDHFGVNTLACAKFFTLFHPENQSQVDFVKHIEVNINWEVVTKRPSEIRRIVNNVNANKHYRFDAQIAYEIGAATGEDYDQIVVVSDSIELIKPLTDAAKYIEGGVNVAFFSDAMDHRWWRALKDSGINFFDLGEIMYTASKSHRPESVEADIFE